MKNAAGTLKRLSFELGGKSANVVFADADLEKAAEFACDGIFFNQGEVCCAGSRLFIEEKIHEPFKKALLAKAEKWQPGDPMDPAAQMGAVVSREQMDKILKYIKIGQKEGAELILDGREPKVSAKGFFIGPTVFAKVNNRMQLAQEEIFGPVLSMLPFKNAKQALAEANESVFGLAAAVFTRDITKAHLAARALKAGTVWVNCYNAGNHAVPFGGYKMSGNAREGGAGALDFYTQRKAVWINLGS